jgi:hypothetical protein
MLIIRVAFLGLLVCIHVVGAAVLFRRLFPRESPWLAFVVPILALLSALNFAEHFVSLHNLGWLLPLTLGGLLWNLIQPGYSWTGLRLPSILFVVLFGIILFLKCLSPDIPNNTEAVDNLNRILNYDLSATLPPIDSWLPPYDYGGYYSFQQYGAAILMRLFSIDLGSACNISFAFLLAWTCLIGAGAAHAITGRMWICIGTAIILLAGSPGSALFLFFLGRPDYMVAININDTWNQPDHNPFAWICAQDKFHPGLKLLPPTYTLYYTQYHADLGGAFMTMATMLSTSLVFRKVRANWPWVCAFVLPMVTIITSAWFFPIILFLCGTALILALVFGRRPLQAPTVALWSGVGVVLLWPSVFSLLGNAHSQAIFWTPADGRTPLWMFAVQWWPVFLPWLFLCFVWDRLDLMGRWIHACLPLLFIGVENLTLMDRGLTVEKMWGELYGAGLVTLIPLTLRQPGPAFRALSGLLLFFGVACLGMWWKSIYYDPIDGHNFARLQGDWYLQHDKQTARLLQVLQRFHGATILPGKSSWAYTDPPNVVVFSENRCYVAYTFQEGQAGHGDEANARAKLNDSFYAGTMSDPLPFLRANHIAAVLIWPGDQISDALLKQFQTQLGSDYFYIDCKMDGPNNAGVFVRQAPPGSFANQ